MDLKIILKKNCSKFRSNYYNKMCYLSFYGNMAAIFLKIFQVTLLADLSTAMAIDSKSIQYYKVSKITLFCLLFMFKTFFVKTGRVKRRIREFMSRVAALVKYYMNGLIPFLEDNRTNHKNNAPNNTAITAAC